MVLAIGNPFGVGQTVTSGIMSALGAHRDRPSRMRRCSSRPMRPSIPAIPAARLVDMAASVLGINTAIFSRSGGSHGIGFAIPSNIVKLIVDSAVAGRKLERPWLGAKLDAGDARDGRGLGLGRVAGALVARALRQGPGGRGGPAGRRRHRRRGRARGGRRAGVVIPPDHARHRQSVRASTSCARAGSSSVDVALRARAAGRQGRRAQPVGRASFRRRARRQHASQRRRRTWSRADQEGVVVLSVRPGSTAARLGLQPGDVVVQVGAVRQGNPLSPACIPSRAGGLQHRLSCLPTGCRLRQQPLEWSAPPPNNLCPGPNGDASFDTTRDWFGGFVLPGAPALGLVGRVGNGPWVQVGSGPTTLSGTGALVFAVNDYYFFFWDNTGSFSVTATLSSACFPGWGHGDAKHPHVGPPGRIDSCYPGHGYGDSNHSHAGPPGLIDKPKSGSKGGGGSVSNGSGPHAPGGPPSPPSVSNGSGPHPPGDAPSPPSHGKEKK